MSEEINDKYSPIINTTSIDQQIGICIHLNQISQPLLDKAKECSISWIRTDMAWAEIEKSKSHFDFSRYDKIVQLTESNNIHILFILDYNNIIYENGASLSNIIVRNAYLNWAFETIKHFKNHNIIWEIYNEPNTPFWHDIPDPKIYTNIVSNLHDIVKKSFPSEVLIGPATSGFPGPYIAKCIYFGILKSIDAVSIHPYVRSPERMIDAISLLNAMISTFKKGSPPMITSEIGYSSTGIGADEQAELMLQTLIILLSHNQKLVFWYDFLDDGENINNIEQNFGLLHMDVFTKKLSMKKSFSALSFFSKFIFKANSIQMINSQSDHTYIFKCNFTDRTSFITWSNDNSPINGNYKFPDLKYQVQNIQGNIIAKIDVTSLKDNFPLSQSVLYISPIH